LSTGRKRIAAILAIDMAGYSSRAEEDAASAASAVSDLHARVRAVAGAHDGRVFSTAGDGLMCEFAAASEAAAAARDMLAGAPEGAPLTRIGVHLGEVYEQDGGDLLGHGVNIAARLEQAAAPGTALISRAAADVVQGDLRAQLNPGGRVALDKMNETIEVFVLDPAARPGHARRPRRRRTWLAAGVLTGIAAGAALAAVLWSAGVIGPSREDRMRFALSDPDARAAMTRALVQQLVADANGQTPPDGTLQAISALQSSQAQQEQAAFASLRAGETERAVQTLEDFGDDLLQRGQNVEAGAAFERASHLATLLAPDKALALARRASAANPRSPGALERTMVLTASLEGPQAAVALLNGVVAREREPSPIRVLAQLFLAQIAMRTGDPATAESLMATVDRDARSFPQDRFLQGARLTVRSTYALTRQRLRDARRDIVAARQLFASIPGEEHRGQAQYMGMLDYSGDYESEWREGRLFLAQREGRGWPANDSLLAQVCLAGIHLRRIDEAAPVCRAAGGAASDPVSAAQARAAFALAQGRLDDARTEIDAIPLMPQGSATQLAPFALEALRTELQFRRGDRAGAEGRLETLLRSAEDLPAPASLRASTLRTFGQLELEAGRPAQGCALLARAAAHYRSFEADAGVTAVQQMMRNARCAV
jgi:class 3 adenylate cyclase